MYFSADHFRMNKMFWMFPADRYHNMSTRSSFAKNMSPKYRNNNRVIGPLNDIVVFFLSTFVFFIMRV